MIGALRRLLGQGPAPGGAPQIAAPALPPGVRAYAVGDIHGRLDLLKALAGAIEADDRQRRAQGSAEGQVILMGDLVDRGPDSAGVLAFAQGWQAQRPLRILMGNHEEMLLNAIDDIEVLRHLLRFGGRETVLSFGVDEGVYTAATFEEVQAMLPALIPAATLNFMRGFEDMIVLGDYIFVHAGIVPGRPLEDQMPQDLRWLREPFLSSREDHGGVVVHGHTIVKAVEVTPNRIGIDTGAYASGCLTALGLEGTRRWLIAARETDGVITTATRMLA